MLVGELSGLVLPVGCAGCGRDDEPWCGGCRAPFAAPPWRCEDRAGRLDPVDGHPLPVRTLAENVGAVRAVVVAWKDRGRRDLTRDVVAAAARLGAGLVPEVVAALALAEVRVSPRGPVLVVAAPSTAAARRRRGFAHADALADGVAAGLRSAGVPAVRVAALRRRSGEQVGLGVRARATVRVEVARRAAPAVRGRPVVLVDDVLTTGATLAAAAAALTVAGALVVAGATLVATPAPGRARRDGRDLGPTDAPRAGGTVVERSRRR
ncbi:ComF family protein [Cellulomonas sp. DKR-3]|uniref:ComF family protein n=1 Tax=Cellulomonas fulva TaxID=2835530 RepID=A0ABS5TZT4_9CELL|nr:phosphoribosyltransferase family protein [Cellulomonas fulva]MBT0994644.1 ComF family protein [Cellulomonas fulva]